MTIFAILRADNASNNEALHTDISSKFPGNFYRLSAGQWLISYDKTAQELSAEFGIVKGSALSGTLVVSISSYYGLYNPQLWEWIRTHWVS
jgi:hypothetical protein